MWQTLTQILYNMNSLEKPEYLGYEKRTIYLSGKVTKRTYKPLGKTKGLKVIEKTLPRWWLWLKFMFWDLFYTGMGYKVYNPVKLIHKSCSYDQAMRTCLQLLEICDYICMIPGWRKSNGANIEFKKAAELGLTCLNSGRTKREFDQRAMMYKADREIEGIKQMIK